MKKHIVTEILSKPEQDAIRLENGLFDEFWYVAVRIKNDKEEYETSITFDSLEEARKLKIGDEFLR